MAAVGVAKSAAYLGTKTGQQISNALKETSHVTKLYKQAPRRDANKLGQHLSASRKPRPGKQVMQVMF